jgi:hypothetical protein
MLVAWLADVLDVDRFRRLCEAVENYDFESAVEILAGSESEKVRLVRGISPVRAG